MAENKNHSSDIILYSSPEGNIKVEVIYSGETDELQEDAVISKMETTEKAKTNG